MQRTLDRLLHAPLWWFVRRWPFETLRWRLVGPAVAAAERCFCTGQTERVVRTRTGQRMRVDPGEYFGRRLFVTGEYEPATSAVIAALLAPGDMMADVGANAGYFSLLAATAVGDAGRVIAFEPAPVTRARLERNVLLNRLANVVIRAEAASDTQGSFDFYEGPPNHSGIASLRPIDNTAGRITVQTHRLDDMLPADRRLALAKIDVEGAEMQALRGLSGRLERDRPDIVLELTDAFLQSMGHSAAELVAMMVGLGYRAYRIDHDGLHALSVDGSAPADQINVLFTHRAELPRPLRIVAD